MKISKTAIIQVRDWTMAIVVILWGGQAIYDKNFKPEDKGTESPKKIFDTDGNDILSDAEIFKAKQLLKTHE